MGGESGYDTVGDPHPAVVEAELEPLQPQFHFTKIQVPLEVAFRSMSLDVVSNGRRVLSNLSGRIVAGNITALMGPSGCGKTTLLQVRSGECT